MAFATYEELKAAVEARRKSVLTLEVDLGGTYSQEHEDAKKELATAKGMKALTGGAGFLGDNIAELEQRVADTRPETQSIWIQFSQLTLDEWGKLLKQANLTAFDQYERVLPQTFIGVFGEDPDPDEKPEGWEAPKPLTTDARSVSTRGGADALLPGGSLHSVVQAFMSWQNSGGEVSIRPTKSGRD
jgi:hypothetical protein